MIFDLWSLPEKEQEKIHRMAREGIDEAFKDLPTASNEKPQPPKNPTEKTSVLRKFLTELKRLIHRNGLSR